MYKIGTKVEIITDGLGQLIYDTYDEMAELMELNNFIHNDNPLNNTMENVTGIIVAKSYHKFSQELLYGIKLSFGDYTQDIIVDSRGIKIPFNNLYIEGELIASLTDEQMEVLRDYIDHL